MTTWFPCIDWNFITSITQVLGVIATFLAVLVALYSNKPHVKLQAVFGPEIKTKKWGLVITAVNVSNTPIMITLIGLSFRKGKKSFRRDRTPTVLTIGDHISEEYSLSELREILMSQMHDKNARKSEKIKVYVYAHTKYFYFKTRYSIKEVLETVDMEKGKI